MNVYLISARPKRTFDIYYSATVIAASPEAAARIHPDGYHKWSEAYSCWADIDADVIYPQLSTWVDPEDVVVELIASAPEQTAERVLCSNFRS